LPPIRFIAPKNLPRRNRSDYGGHSGHTKVTQVMNAFPERILDYFGTPAEWTPLRIMERTACKAKL
jgi:hypothetical protein